MKYLCACFIFIYSLNLFAANDIIVETPAIRLTPPNAPITAIYLKITNHRNFDLNLVSVKGEFAGKFELHDMEMSQGKMVMREIKSILIKRHTSTELRPGGLHIMVFKMKKALKEGDVHKLTLIFDDKSSLPVMAKVVKF